jgi:hypothetical protein
MSEIPGIGYRPPSYRPAADAVWFSVLYGHVPGFQLEYMYRPNTQGDNPSKLEPQHLRHLDAIIKFLENSAGSPAAFALVNLSTHDTRHRPGRGGLALVCSLRVRGAVDQAGRPGPVFTHSALCVDEPVEEDGLAQVLVDFVDRVDRYGTPWYQEYARAGQEHAETEIARYMQHFTSLGPPGARAALAPLRRRDPLEFRRLEIVCPQGLTLDATLARGVARLSTLLYHSNLRWTYVTNGSVPGEDSAAELSVRFVAVHGSGAGVHTLDLDSLLRMADAELLQLLHLAVDAPAPIVHFHPVQAAPPPASTLSADAPTPPMAPPSLNQETVAVPEGGAVCAQETVVAETRSGERAGSAAAASPACEAQTVLAGNEPIAPQLPIRTGDETQMLDKDRLLGPAPAPRRALNGSHAPKRRRAGDAQKVLPKTRPIALPAPTPPPPPERRSAETNGVASDEMTQIGLPPPRPVQGKKRGEPGLLLMSLAGALMVLVVAFAWHHLTKPRQQEIRPLPRDQVHAAAPLPPPPRQVAPPPKQVAMAPPPKQVAPLPPKQAPVTPPPPRQTPVAPPPPKQAAQRAKSPPKALARQAQPIRAKPVVTAQPSPEVTPPKQPEDPPQPKKTDVERSDELVRKARDKADNARTMAEAALQRTKEAMDSCAQPPSEMSQASMRVETMKPKIVRMADELEGKAKNAMSVDAAQKLLETAQDALDDAKKIKGQAEAVKKYADKCKR